MPVFQPPDSFRSLAAVGVCVLLVCLRFTTPLPANPRPSQPLAQPSCLLKAAPDPLLYERPLEFSHGSDNLKHQSAGGGAEIEVVLQ